MLTKLSRLKRRKKKNHQILMKRKKQKKLLKNVQNANIPMTKKIKVNPQERLRKQRKTKKWKRFSEIKKEKSLP